MADRAGDSKRASSGARQMTFGQHLEELRSHVIRSVIVLFGLCVISFIFQDELAALVMGPFLDARATLNAEGREIESLTFIDPTEGLFFHLKIAMYGALILGLPYLLYEMWRFIGVGLYPNERRAVLRVLPISFALLLLGVLFSYLAILPVALDFLLGYGNPEYIQPEIRLDSYLGFFVMLCIIMGVIFQLPLVQVVLARFGIMPVETQARNRKAFIMGSVILAALVTPTGDAVTLLLVTVPMFILFEIGLFVSRRVGRFSSDGIDEMDDVDSDEESS